MGKGLLTLDNILIVGVAGTAGAYFTDFQGAKGIIDGYIAELMNAIKLPGGGGGVDCTANPDDPSCTGGGGGGTGCDDPLCTSECCKCKCKDRVNCPEGQCCDKCKNECPSQCGSQSATYLDTYPTAGDAELPIPDPPQELQLPEPYGAGGIGPISFGGFNFPDNNTFFDDEFDPVENSVSGFRSIVTQYVLPVPRTNTTMHTREADRKMEDGIKYHLG